MLRTILLLTKGIIRDQRLRRLMMFWIMIVALVMLFLGSWLLSDRGREHPWLYLGFWFVCAWLTLTGMLLALLDILVLRATQRAARRVLEKQMLDEHLKDEDNR